MTTLTIDQKKHVFLALRKKESQTLQPFLIIAAEMNYTFPALLENPQLRALKVSFSALKDMPIVQQPLKEAINLYFIELGTQLFADSLNSTFDENNWPAELLVFLAKSFDIQIDNQPLVNLAIKDGKVYWQIVNGTNVLYDRTARKDIHQAFDFKNTPTLTMTWDTFRVFKDSGKRGGTNAITKARFVAHFQIRQQTAAENIWNQLKQKGILDKHDRLSHYWHNISGKVALQGVTSAVNYDKISTVLNQIGNDSSFAETIPYIPSATIFRLDRSPKSWKLSSRIQNLEPKSDKYKVEQWDVDSYGNLTSHAQSGDGLDHDHIPSVFRLEDFKKTLINQSYQQIDTINQRIKSGYANADDQLTLNQWQTYVTCVTPETKDNWGCVELPESLHKQGLTYKLNKAEQKIKITEPFYNEVEEYLNILEKDWQQTQIDDNYLKALGAFRYAFRSQSNGKFGTVPFQFFNQNLELKQKIDSLIFERLQLFMDKREGKSDALWAKPS